MQYTKNYELKKPELNDFYNVEDFNENVEKIDKELKSNAEKIDTVSTNIDDIANAVGTEKLQTTAQSIIPAINEISSVAKGKNRAKVFSTTESMNAWLSDSTNAGVANVGDNLYIIDTGVPDWWISEVLTEQDETGRYYKIAQLETQKVDLTTYEARIQKNANDISALNNDLAKYLPLSGGTMTGSIAGNNGGYFATDGNVFSPLWGGWLHNKLNQFLDVTGSDMIINPISDVNNFGTGIALFCDVLNLPASDWFLIISGGGNGTNVQVAYAMGGGVSFHRNCANGVWSGWVRTDDPCRIEYWNAAGALFPYGNIAVFRCYDDSGYASVQASAFTQLSSKYAKENIVDISSDEASKVLNLRTVTFDYKNGQKNQVGFIAEEVLKILPNCVFLPDGYVEDANAHESKLPSIDYSKFVPYIVKEIQVLNDRITKLEENK